MGGSGERAGRGAYRPAVNSLRSEIEGVPAERRRRSESPLAGNRFLPPGGGVTAGQSPRMTTSASSSHPAQASRKKEKGQATRLALGPTQQQESSIAVGPGHLRDARQCEPHRRIRHPDCQSCTSEDHRADCNERRHVLSLLRPPDTRRAFSGSACEMPQLPIDQVPTGRTSDRGAPSPQVRGALSPP